MTAEKTDAIVLRVLEFSETSCIATFLTRDFGKITGLAKGARRRKSPFDSALDLLSMVRLVFLRKSSGNLELLTEARLERRFRSASINLERYYAALHVAELLTVFTEYHDANPELFDLAVRTIVALDSGSGNPSVYLLGFEMQMLELTGHAPSLSTCAGCSVAVELSGHNPVGLLAGGILCGKCRAGQSQVVILSDESIRLGLRLQSDEWPVVSREPDTCGSSPVGQLRGMLNQFESAILGFRPRTQAWLKR